MVQMLSKDVFKISQPLKDPDINKPTNHPEPATVHFQPRLVNQRLSFIISTLEYYNTQTVLDIGSGPGTLLVELLNHRARLPNLTTVLGVDIDEQLIQETSHKLRKNVSYQRSQEFPDIFIQLWNASLTIFNPRFRLADTIVATEVIEHLDDEELHSFSTLVFGAYHPTVVVLTTPNYDFNKFFDSPVNEEERRTTRFKDPTGRTDRVFRQADHRFEWTMDEFQAWCNHIAATYGYKVEFSGVGPFWSYPTRQDYTNGPDLNVRPPRDPDQFFASQISIFRVTDPLVTEHTFIL